MKRSLFLGFGFLLCAVAVMGRRVYADELIWKESAQSAGKIKAVLLNNRDAATIFIGTDKGVWKSSDGGRNWSLRLKLPGLNTAVHYLLHDLAGQDIIYAATDSGLYATLDKGGRWVRLFKGKNAQEGAATVLAVAGDAIYLGTKNGLFISRNKGRSWKKESGKLGSSSIVAVAKTTLINQEIFVACVEGVYRTTDAGIHWERVFNFSSMEVPLEESETKEENTFEKERFPGIRHFMIHTLIANCMYVATSKGVYASKDKGAHWEILTIVGLSRRDVVCLSLSPGGGLYALTKTGLFSLKINRWIEVSRLMAGKEFNYLCFDKSGALYCATDNGLFIASPGNSIFENNSEAISFYCKGEPSIKDIQRAAVTYAEVEPEKIKRWRAQAARKALLPSLSFGLDSNSTDLWHWEAGSSTKADDDCLRRGRATIDWGITVSWNLGELIWNNDQTSIDVRSRLTTQLRQDILDEVNKLYFERIRRKIELSNLAIEDRKKRLENELGIQELTASLDALTGGYYSGSVKP